MPNPIIPDPSALWEAAGIYSFPNDRAIASTDGDLAFFRVSTGPQVYNGSLSGQQQDVLEAISNAGGNVVATVGGTKHQSGKLDGPRPDLAEAVALAKRENLAICALNITRIFRAAAFDPVTNPFAEYTLHDLKMLRQHVPLDTPLSVIEPPETTMRKLKSKAVKQGMRRAEAKGVRLGRPLLIDDPNVIEMMVWDRMFEHKSLDQIAREWWCSKSFVQRLFERTEVVQEVGRALVQRYGSKL